MSGIVAANSFIASHFSPPIYRFGPIEEVFSPLLLKVIKGTFDPTKALLAHMRVDLGRLARAMP